MSWMRNAICRDLNPELFHPAGESTRRTGPALAQQRAAKKVCWTQCPVRTQCLKWALEVGEPHGIVGGLAEHERRRLSARLRIVAKNLPLGRALDQLLGLVRCKRNHVMSPENTKDRSRPGRRHMECKRCMSIRSREAEQRAAVTA